MTTSAPRIAQPLLEALPRLDDGMRPIAEVCRLVGAEADSRGLTRPSYERIRVLVHLLRAIDRRRTQGPSVVQMMWEVGAGARSGPSLTDNMARPREERR
ncbi:MAG: hypothetical protein ACXVFF_08315 [Gaiellaceae bacterium]